jgi:hypothetical protein
MSESPVSRFRSTLAGTEIEITTMKRHSFSSESARRAFGLIGIVGFVALAFCSDANVLTRSPIMSTGKAEDSLIGARNGFHFSLGDEGAMPDLNGAVGWLNSVPLNQSRFAERLL